MHASRKNCMHSLFYYKKKEQLIMTTKIIYVLYQNDNGTQKQKACTASRQDTPDLVKLYRKTAKKLKSRPRKGTYYIIESGGCLYLEDRKTGQILYSLCPVCW